MWEAKLDGRWIVLSDDEQQQLTVPRALPSAVLFVCSAFAASAPRDGAIVKGPFLVL